jgi:hypothetical protein
MIVFLTKDLFFIPVLQSSGAKQGIDVIGLFKLDSPKAAEIEPALVTACVLDLAGRETQEIAEIIASFRSTYPGAQIAAFGPHVQAGLLHAATEAGCDQVLTRGQLNSQIDRLVAGWAGK